MSRSVCRGGELRIAQHDGLIMIVGIGFWNEGCLDEHFATLRTLIARRRLSTPSVRGLVDLRASAVQRPSMIEGIRENAHSIWQPQDRVAIVVSSSLSKLQMNRLASDDTYRIFDSVGEALSWLEGDSAVSIDRPATISALL
jgi:hypothetical protein